MKYLLKFIITLILFTQSLPAASEVKKVTLQLSWFNQFQFAGYYIAKDKGFYKELGLNVEIKPFQFGIDIPKEVSNNTIDFAIGREALILDRAKHKNIVALYALFQTSPLVLLTTKESKINSISDFKNKRIMTTIANASEVSLKAMLKSKNINLEDLDFLKHTHNINDLITKKTDIISAYTSKSPYNLQKQGISYNIFEPKEHGFDMYSDLLYTNEHLISNELKMVKAFKKASLKGWEYAYSHIEESAELIHEKYNTQNLSKEELIFEGKELKKLSFYNTNVLGSIDKNKLKRIADLYNVMGLLDNQVDINKFIYNESINNLKFTSKEQNYLKNKKEITMCIDPDWLPFEKNDNGKHIGMSADYFKLFEKSISIPIRMIPTKTWSQSLALGQNKRCDIFSLVMATPQRVKYLDFSQPYLKTPLVIVTNNNALFISNLSELRNKKIGIVKGYAYSELLKTKNPEMNFVDVKNLKDGLDRVDSEELFAFIGGLATVGFKIQNNYIGQLKIAGKIDDILELGIGTRNDEPILKSIFNKAISKISIEEHQKILNKWVSVNYQQGVEYQTIWRYLAILIILSIVLILIYRQYLLKDLNKKLNEKVKIEIEKNIQQNKILSEQSKMAAMGEMLGNIAHQWRQPLSTISTASTGTKLQKEMGCLSDGQLDSALTTINTSAQYLSQTIDDFRGFFNPKNNIEKEFYISNTFSKTLNLVSAQFTAKEIEIIQNIENFELSSIENELIQVLINILNNARDALLKVENQRRFIFINTYKKNNSIVIEIKDNAKGIPEDIIDRIFEPYFTTKHKSQGTGIGLYMSEEIIKNHLNGRLTVSNDKYSYEGINYTGAKFTIKISID